MGLDFHRSAVHREEQIQGLKWQLELANELHLPVIIHNRQSTKEMIEILGDWVQKSQVKSPGVIHCFQENADNARVFLEMGFYLAFGGYIGYPNSHLAEVIKPYRKTGCWWKRMRLICRRKNSAASVTNRPISLSTQWRKWRRFWDLTAERAAEITTENACRLFKFKIIKFQESIIKKRGYGIVGLPPIPEIAATIVSQ